MREAQSGQAHRILILGLQLGACFVFLGRAWQHIRWDAPLRTLLWNQRLMEPIVESFFGMSWREWASSPTVDAAIQNTIKGMGFFYLVCAVLVWFAKPKGRIIHGILIAGSALLLFLSWLYFLENWQRIGQLIEYTLQWTLPVFLVLALRGRPAWPKLIMWLKIAIALTFVGHGLYAVGYYPRPGHFVTMTMNALSIEQQTAEQLLYVAGLLDFAVAVLIFIPRAATPALLYDAFWGFLTALARMVAYFDPNDLGGWASGWIHQTLFRLPHGLIPLLVWWVTKPGNAWSATPICNRHSSNSD
jgi:hypothetical protein